MKKYLVGSLLVTAMSCAAQAADISNVSVEDKARLVSLTERVESLQSKLGQSASLGRLSDVFDTGYVHYDDEYAVLFDTLPDTTFEVELLKKNHQLSQGTWIIGGSWKFNAQHWDGNSVKTSSSTTLADGDAMALTGAKVDIMANMNNWVSAFVTFKGNNLTTTAEVTADRYFISFGNTDLNPLFMLVGRTHLPFGVFGGGGPLASSLTNSAFKGSTTDQVWFGFDNHTLNTNISLFTNDNHNTVSNFVYSMFYNGEYAGAEYTLGLGYLHDVRFTGSALGQATTSAAGSVLKDLGRLPVGDINFAVKHGDFKLTGEYMRAMHGVSVGTGIADLTTDGQTLGHPQSFYLAGAYTPDIWGRHSYFTIAYSATKHMPGVRTSLNSDPTVSNTAYYGQKDQWVVGFSQEILHNVLLGLEVQNATTYKDEKINSATVDLNYYF